MLPPYMTPMRNASHRPGHSYSRGFTLVEIMVVVVIIGLLAALAVPAYQRVKRRSQNSTVVNGLRVFSQAFETYQSQNGAWPANVGPSVVPPGMNSADLKTSTWKSAPAIGGEWNWDYFPTKPFGFTAGISLSNFTCDDAQLAEIDAMIDDGNLSTGLFQKVAGNRATYILEQ